MPKLIAQYVFLKLEISNCGATQAALEMDIDNSRWTIITSIKNDPSREWVNWFHQPEI